MNQIVVRIIGGLGNQLFCYAAACRPLLVNNAEFVIDDISCYVHDHEYQCMHLLDRFSIQSRKTTPAVRLEPLPHVYHYLKRALDQRLPFAERSYGTKRVTTSYRACCKSSRMGRFIGKCELSIGANTP